MELQTSHIFAFFLALCCLALSHGMPTQSGDDVFQESAGLPMAKRPKYMDTRRELDIFKDLVLASLQELVDEDRLNPAILPSEEAKESSQPPVKRMRYMGVCMRKHNKQFIPFPCVRSGR